MRTLVALGEVVPQACPNFKGPQLDIRKFSQAAASSGRPLKGAGSEDPGAVASILAELVEGEKGGAPDDRENDDLYEYMSNAQYFESICDDADGWMDFCKCRNLYFVDRGVFIRL